RLRPDEVEDIRRRSAVPQDDIVEFEQDHFMRMI
ncbi:ABC transporter ATP-binding protein, partial [Rhizobium ruizarguesonis]